MTRVVRQGGEYRVRTQFDGEWPISPEDAERRLAEQGPTDGPIGDAAYMVGKAVTGLFRRHAEADATSETPEVPGIIYDRGQKHKR